MTGPRRRRSSLPLQDRLENVVDVEDAGRLVECAQIDRQLQFQYLVRRYLSQILYGCTNAYCTTPTCLTCNKRLVSRPYRAPTQLTARALAYYLASQDNPHRGLCPHPLKIAPRSLRIDGARGVGFRQAHDGATQLYNVLPVARGLGAYTALSQRDSIDERLGDGGERNQVQSILDAVNKRHQARKDPKSLGQSLYDTVTMIFSYSKQIPSPQTIFASLRSPSDSEASVESAMYNMTINGSRPPARRESSDAAFTGHANGHAVPPTVNGSCTPAEAPPHDPHSNTKTPRKSNMLHISSEVLANGEQIHKIRHPLPDSASNGHPWFKPLGLSPLDGTLEHTLIGKHKMRSKAASLDLHLASTMSLLTPTSAAAPKDASKALKSKEKRPTLPVVAHLTCDIMDQLKEEVYHHRNDQSSDFNFVIDYDTNRRYRPTKPFVNRSMFFALSDPEALLKSFHDQYDVEFKNSPLPHLDSRRLTYAFRDWNQRNGALIFDSLWASVEALFRPPPELDTQKSPRLKPSRKDAAMHMGPEHQPASTASQAAPGRYLSDQEAAHIIMICIHALTSLVPVGWTHTWTQLRKFRSWGIAMPNAPPHTDSTDAFMDPWLSIIDELEYEPAIRLADRLLRGIGARICFEHVLTSLGHGVNSRDKFGPLIGSSPLLGVLIRHLREVERVGIASKKKMRVNIDTEEDPGGTTTAIFMEWLRTIIIKKWDGKPEIHKWGSVGTAIMLLESFYRNGQSLNLRPHMFYFPYLNERIDSTHEPVEFLSWEDRPNSFHILQHPFLFPREYLVGYFRTINFTSMLQQFERTERTARLERQMEFLLREPYWWTIRSELKVALSDYLVLDISREDSLRQTLDQLWKQQKRMLLKPLKVRMGMQEGEVGLDQGGVTYEFFRLVLNEAFMPDKGMFTIDPQASIIWFQPASLEPLWKFRMLGVLFSLAVYNGITLPVTFPLIFYKHLLGPDHPRASGINLRDRLTTDVIYDGWPALAKALDELLAWKDGDVKDIIMREYTFSFDAFGSKIDVDMQAFDGRPWPAEYEDVAGPSKPATSGSVRSSEKQRLALNDIAWQRPRVPHSESSSSTETPMVTNANREKFVRDYIHWLTYRSVEPQLEAFREGFLTCLHPKSLHLFSASSLKALIEGTQEISIPALRKATHYEEGYSATHHTITDFWDIVEKYSDEDKRRLLEFVTASERVPVTGFESMNFVIVRAGDDTERLPTSSTCFGKLVLPEYASKEKLKTKLGLAIQNSKGFGVV